jgi:hypothetical protein
VSALRAKLPVDVDIKCDAVDEEQYADHCCYMEQGPHLDEHRQNLIKPIVYQIRGASRERRLFTVSDKQMRRGRTDGSVPGARGGIFGSDSNRAAVRGSWRYGLAGICRRCAKLLAGRGFADRASERITILLLLQFRRLPIFPGILAQ